VPSILWGTLLCLGVVVAASVQAQKRAEVLRSTVWETREIPVCWENPADTPLDRQRRQWTREAVQETWERHSPLRFRGWQACTARSRGSRIRIADEGPYVKRLGKHLDGVPDSMVMNFTFHRWALSCAQTRRSALKSSLRPARGG